MSDETTHVDLQYICTFITMYMYNDEPKLDLDFRVAFFSKLQLEVYLYKYIHN